MDHLWARAFRRQPAFHALALPFLRRTHRPNCPRYLPEERINSSSDGFTPWLSLTLQVTTSIVGRCVQCERMICRGAATNNVQLSTYPPVIRAYTLYRCIFVPIASWWSNLGCRNVLQAHCTTMIARQVFEQSDILIQPQVVQLYLCDA